MAYYYRALFNHIHQMAPIVDADANSLVSAGEAARGAGSCWLCHASSRFRRHLLLAVHKCGLLHVAWSVCLSVCVFNRVLGTWVTCAKTAEPIEMLIGRQTRVRQGTIN